MSRATARSVSLVVSLRASCPVEASSVTGGAMSPSWQADTVLAGARARCLSRSVATRDRSFCLAGRLASRLVSCGDVIPRCRSLSTGATTGMDILGGRARGGEEQPVRTDPRVGGAAGGPLSGQIHTVGASSVAVSR
jgi:hypothetical protein